MSLHSGAGAHPDVPVEVYATKIDNNSKKKNCFVGFTRVGDGITSDVV